MRFLADYIMKGRIQAISASACLAMLSLPLPPISIVSSATVGLVTLRLGAAEGFYVLVSSCLTALLLSLPMGIGFQFALVYALTLWLPVWLIAIVLREGRHLALAIEIAILLGVIGVLLVYGLQDQPAQMWNQILETTFQPMLTLNPDIPADQVKQWTDILSYSMTGISAASTLIAPLLGLFLARGWQAMLFNPGGFRYEFLTLKSRKALAITTLIILAIAKFASGTLQELCVNILIVLSVLYSFVGTAVLHALLAQKTHAKLMLTLFYVSLLMPQMMIFVMLCGVSDNWLDLRKKISNPTTA